MEMLRIAAAYIRVSTDDQVEYSPDAQLAEIRKYAAGHGYLLPEEFIFMDEGISGRGTEKRPQFNRMIGTAKQAPRPFDAILLWKFSRFARNREDSIVYKSMLRKELGIDVVSISEPLSDDKMSILMEAMIEAMDEYYSVNLAEEVRRGMTEKARRGEIQCPPPFGYRLDGKQLIPHEEEAPIVQSIFQRFLSGEGLFPLARWMNDMGIKTHRGNAFENRTVEYILRNPVYIGKLRWNPTGRTRRKYNHPGLILAAGNHTPLISQETWGAAQLRLDQIKSKWKYHGRPVTELKRWYSGLVRCASCGATMIFAAPHYWKCGNYARGRCRITQHITDEKLEDMLMAVLSHDCQSSVPIDFSVVHRSASVIDESTLLEEQRKKTLLKLDRLREAYLSGVESLDGYKAAKSDLESDLDRIASQIQVLSSSESPQSMEAEMRSRIVRLLELLSSPAATKEQKHDAATDVIDHCTFSKKDNLFKIHYRFFLDQ